jgi:hypothetical protein
LIKICTNWFPLWVRRKWRIRAKSPPPFPAPEIEFHNYYLSQSIRY